MPPPPSSDTSFVSDPDPTNSNIRYTGGIVFTYAYGGLTSLYGLYIRNTGIYPIPIDASDFTGVPSGGIAGRIALKPLYAWMNEVRPNEQMTLGFSVEQPISSVVWTIGGKFGTVTVLFSQPVGSFIIPAPSPGCQP